MKLLKLDSVGGASGDMILGTLVGLGASIEAITETLQSMNLDPFFLSEEKVIKEGIEATKVTVHLGEQEGGHGHSHEGHSHKHTHDHAQDHGHDHHDHRHLSEILRLIDAGGCPDEVKSMAGKIFQRLGEAEASVHGIPVEDVHFHEVGAMDSIVDILGACIAYHQLGIEGVICGPLPVGQGWFDCAHGRYPLPPPATERLLQGFPTQPTEIPKELVTPTGAAILSTWHDPDLVGKTFISLKSAFGAGDRDLPGRPNVLRGALVECTVETEDAEESVICLETNLDDADGETLAYVQQKLLDTGALDVVLYPCIMKKGRPGIVIQVLCNVDERTNMERVLFSETGTLGLRWRKLNRTVLDRKEELVKTPYGEITVKVSYFDGEPRSMKPEMDECIRLAEKHKVPAEKIRIAAVRAYEA